MSSMMTTQTMSILSLTLKTSPSILTELNEKLDQLNSILFQFQEWNDPLSNKMFEWGSKILQLDIPENGNEFIVNKIREEAARRIHELVNKILINPLDGAPLQEPLLDCGNLVCWEKWMLQDYQSISSLSPFDNQPFQTMPHFFAIKILEWIHTARPFASELNENATPSTQSSSLVSSTTGTSIAIAKATFLDRSMASPSGGVQNSIVVALKTFTYIQLAQQANVIRMHEDQISQMKKEMVSVDKLREEMRLLNKQQVEKAEQNATAHFKIINTRIESIDQTYQRTVNQLETQLTESRAFITATNQRLANAEQVSAFQEKELQQMRLAYAKKARETEEMRTEIERKNSESDRSLCVIQ